MPDIAENISSLKRTLPASVKIIAVSKTKTVNDIMQAYNAGQRCFGENRVQELLSKKDNLPADIDWHLIGHLQRNKVKYIIPFIGMIESVDSARLLGEINSEACKIGRIIRVLLQIHIAREETKFGFSMDELILMLTSPQFRDLKNIRICGVMGMATFTSDSSLVRDEFRFLAECYTKLKVEYFPSGSDFSEISMGMSGDYLIAVEEGSTMVRIGSRIFGERTGNVNGQA